MSEGQSLIADVNPGTTPRGVFLRCSMMMRDARSKGEERKKRRKEVVGSAD